MMNLLEIVASGVAACMFLDIWQQVLRFASGLPATNWGLVGRWFVHAGRGRFFHDAIAKEPPERNEVSIGWIGHYAVGLVYGFVYVGLMRQILGIPPSLANGLIFGALSVVVPWFFFMPAMGVGVLARKAPAPTTARLQALASHTVFGLGLAAGSSAV
jgi:hypothetical protein